MSVDEISTQYILTILPLLGCSGTAPKALRSVSDLMTVTSVIKYHPIEMLQADGLDNGAMDPFDEDHIIKPTVEMIRDTIKLEVCDTSEKRLEVIRQLNPEGAPTWKYCFATYVLRVLSDKLQEHEATKRNVSFTVSTVSYLLF